MKRTKEEKKPCCDELGHSFGRHTIGFGIIIESSLG